LLSVSAITLIDAVSVDSGFPARHILGNPAPLQGAGAEDFVLAENFEGGGGHAGDGNRIAQRVEDFDGVPLCAVRGHVMVHQFYDVAATETMLRHIAAQRYICVEIELHSVLRLSGMSVTNFVTPDKCSVIQMVRTASATPFGPVSVRKLGAKLLF
jgi:hypothetical protein